MRYSQTKEQSAELLRIVLARMGQHDAAFNPLTYTVWFEYASGMNARLNQALDRLLQTRPRLSDADLCDLYQAHIADVDPQAMHRIGSELQQVMATLASAAARQTGVDLGNADQVTERLQSEAVKALLQTAHTEAAGRQVFGSPFVIVDGEAFFGVDRLPQIAAKLAAV